jgi:hypothetical protein
MDSPPAAEALPAEFGGGAVPPAETAPPAAPVVPIPPVAPILDPFAADAADEFAPAAPTPPAAPVPPVVPVAPVVAAAAVAATTPDPAPVAPPVEPPAAPPAAATWALIWPGGEVPIGGNAIVIGRSKDCDVPLADGNVSRRHAELGRSEEGFVLRDLDSTNGTMVNGRRIRSATIGAGDEIMIGMSTLRIEQRHG